MKKQQLYGTRYNAMAGYPDRLSPHALELDGPGSLIAGPFDQSLSELGNLKRALASGQQQIETLSGTIASLEQKLLQMAKKCAHAQHFGYHDELTGLPNRSLLIDRLKQAIVQSARQHKQVVILFIDLDKFKNVNDNFGHAVGDKLLQQVAERLTDCLRYGDTACRYGGDEFVIMLPEMEGQESMEAVTKKIRTCLADSYHLDGIDIKVTASIGTAVYRNDGQECSDLIKQADTAMYLAKADSLPIRLFEQAMS